MTEEKKDEQPHWFAMRATYRSEFIIQKELEDENLQCFVPITIVEERIHGRKKLSKKPAIASLIFVFGPQKAIQDFKKTQPRLQYMCTTVTDRQGNSVTQMRVPIIVPDEQMKAFMRLHEGSKYEITDDLEIINSIQPGQRVRVVDGPLEGLEGTFQRIKGFRNRRFIIAIKDIALISTAEVSPNQIEVIE